MLVVEGPDGSGKTTLVKQLSEMYKLIPVKRDMESEVSAYQWMIDELQTWQINSPIKIYDRFPLIGERIHGPILRQQMELAFYDREAMKLLLMRVVLDGLIIYCRPTLGHILANTVDESPQIVANLRRIVHAYDRLFRRIPHVKFSYHIHSLGILDEPIRTHLSRWKANEMENR
ncbi:MAG: hypothetical protein ACRDSF_00230 [Pseudonocardiaceae bacterium]